MGESLRVVVINVAINVVIDVVIKVATGVAMRIVTVAGRCR
jgi:hypothetical protein